MRVSELPALRGDDAHWHAAHRERARLGVAQDMEGRGGFHPGAGARGVHRALLVRWPTCLAIVVEENELAAGAPRGQFGEESVPLVRQNDAARFARLALADGSGPGLGVEVQRRACGSTRRL
jgi:hypothetical protein